MTDEAKMLSALLARIHRDGGHYELAHGTEKAVKDADEIVANLYAKLEAEKLPNFSGMNPLFTPAVYIYEALEKLKQALRAMEDDGPGAAVWRLRVSMHKTIDAMEQLSNAEAGKRYAQGRKEGLRDGRSGCVCDKGEHCSVHDLPMVKP